MEKNRGTWLAVFVVAAAVIIWAGIWFANSLNQPSGGTQATDMSANNTTPQPTAVNQTITTMDGLQITDTTIGTGTAAAVGNYVTVNYTGTLDDGTVFDSSLKPGRTPFGFLLGAHQVIQGWDEGVQGMKVGGTRELVIPAALGYGSQGAGSVIPPNATLHFTVTLLSVSTSTPSSSQ